MAKLAVIFPGVGYTQDKPLLYYGIKILRKRGYDVKTVNYNDASMDLFVNALKNRNLLGEKRFRDVTIDFISRAEKSVEAQLQDINFSACSELVFMGKSVGTAVGSIYAAKRKLKPYNILITPLEQTMQLEMNSAGIVFCGEEDPLADCKKIEAACVKKNMQFHSFAGSNHSLETGDAVHDIEQLLLYGKLLEGFFDGMTESLYNFEIPARDGRTVSMSDYKGKVLLIVNTATGCGFTPQYTFLEQMYREHREEGFEILDFPCNQFMQAPGSSEEIHSFCTSRYNISFPQFAKIHVNGDDQLPLYEFLKKRQGFKGFDRSTQDGMYLHKKCSEWDPDYESKSDIKWNFTKFLVDRTGKVVGRYEAIEDMEKIKKDVESLM